MATTPIDFSSIGGKRVDAAPIDFSSVGGKQVSPAPPQTPTGTISAVHPSPGIAGKIADWTDKVSNDIKYGTDETGIGTVLKKMGAHGVYSGNPEAVGDFMASLPLGLLRMAKGHAELENPGVTTGQGVKDVTGGALQAATIPSAFVAPEAGEIGAKGVSALAEKSMSMIPSASRAGQAFKEVKAIAGDQPVNLENVTEGALRLMDWQKKTQLGPTINKFLNRITNPKMGPMTYDEARDFYQLLGKMSADEASKLPPSVRFDLTRTVVGLKKDVGNAAEAVGSGDKYYQAMKEFHQAKTLESLSDATKQIIWEALKRGAGLGFGGYAARKLWDAAGQ